MTMETAMWVLGAILVPAIGWAHHVTTTLRRIQDRLDGQREVVTDLRRVVEDNTIALREISTLIRVVEDRIK